MSFANAARAAKAVAERAAPLAGTAAVLAVQAPAQAREVQHSGPSSPVGRIARIKDEFELVDMDGAKPVFSRPIFDDEEVIIATRAFRAFASPDNDVDTDTSEGTVADGIIEAFGPPSHAIGDVGLLNPQCEAALGVATRLLRHPGVQRAIFEGVLADPEILSILGVRMDADGYLADQGFAARGVLPAPQQASEAQAGSGPIVTEVGDEDGCAGSCGAAAGRDPLAKQRDGIVRALQRAGAGVAEFGAWLRACLLWPWVPEARAGAEQAPRTIGEAASSRGDSGSAGGGWSKAATLKLLGRAGQVAVVLVVLILFRRAGVRGAPRMAKAAGGAARR